MSFVSTASTTPRQTAGALDNAHASPTEIARVDVYERIEDVADIWDELEAVAAASVYQTRRWVSLWLASKGAEVGIVPMIIVLRGRSGEALGLLPLGAATRAGLRIAAFLGGGDSNSNMGLFKPGLEFQAASLRAALAQAGRTAALRVDLFALVDQPASWDGVANPMAPLFSGGSLSSGHAARLGSDFVAWRDAKLSPDSRKKLLKKGRRLEREIGPISHSVAHGQAAVDEAVEAFFTQKLTRFESLGIRSEWERPCARRFLREGALADKPGSEPPIELHVMKAGERIVAIYGGGVHRGRFHAMFNSFDLAEEISRCSPGDLLLMSMLEQMTARGLAWFDLGLGEARYKDAWCECVEPMFDSLIPVSAKGLVHAALQSATRRLKRTIKQTPWLWALTKRIRKSLAGGRRSR